jgi:F-type H+-transporting ATPase subunit b
MRHSIRDLLLMMSVLIGGLATSLSFVTADDQQPPPSVPAATSSDTEQPPASSEDPSAAPEAPIPDPPESEQGDEASKPSDDGSQDAVNDDAAAGDEESGDEPHDEGATGHDTPSPTGGDDGGHHDLTNLGHLNATDSIADPSEFKSDLAIWTLVVFLCLLTLLGKFAWGPIMDGLERRETFIAATIDEAEQAAAKGAEQLALYEAKLAAAADETREILAQARKDAEATGERIVAEAQEAAGRERDKAVADIFAAKNSALQEITERSVDLAVSMAGRMIQRQLTPDDRAGLIREALDQLPNQN